MVSPFADMADQETGVDLSLSIMPKPPVKRSPFPDMPEQEKTSPFADMADMGARSTEEMIAIEGGGLKAPGDYTGSWWKDILPSLFDPGVWMTPEYQGALRLTKPLQRLIPGRHVPLPSASAAPTTPTTP